MQTLCVLFPAHNEAASIGRLVREVEGLRAAGIQIVRLVVNDGSTDDTALVAADAGAMVLSHPKRRGVGAALRTGLGWARAHGIDFLVHMDADGQLLTSEILSLLEPVRSSQADMSTGSQFLVGTGPEGLALWKATLLKLTARLVGLAMGVRLSDISCGFRCLNRRVIEVVSPTFDIDYVQELLIQAIAHRARIREVPITANYGSHSNREAMSAHSLRYGLRFVALTVFALVDYYRTRWRKPRPSRRMA